MTQHSSPILVLGGTGKTGRRVAQRLEARGVPVRIGSRSATPAFDWEDRDTWPAALAGVGGVYVSFYPDLAVPGAADAVGALAAQAVAAGAERIVLLSGRGEEEAERAEQRVRAVAPRATILRATWFAQNFSESFMAEGILAGEVALPADGVPEPFVDVEDIADIALAALTGDDHAGELYELTGPRPLTFGDAVAEIAAATGRAIAYVPTPIDAYAAALTGAGVPPVEVALITYLFSEVLDGRNARVADGVQRALGRPPRDFGDYARDAAASGAWDA
ncbi:MAG: NmrA family transcriptional regulator [Solirubrobacteraceae bacterium]